MSELPTGTITFLLTDIEGSTALWERLPHDMGAVIARHDALLTGAIERHGGRVVRSRGEGDSFFAVFPRATDAVAAACALQLALAAERWPLPAPLRVRAGLNTGEAELREGDYYGSAINRCARLRALAYGGQTLLSQATCQLVGDTLPAGMSLRDLGTHRLKDLQRPEQVYQLLHPDLPPDFPPLKSLDALPNNLPLQLTHFIGREKEIAEVKRLLAETPLLTLSGAGGAGKTRLALQVAAELLEEYPDGVWLVELAPIAPTEPARVGQEVARVLGVREQPGRTLTELLVEHLRSRQLLLLLDNCEHLVAACADLVNTVLRSCPNVRVLATSRELLGLMGESAWRVPPLSLPDRRSRPDPEQLAQFESVKLFIDRALASHPRFTLTRQNGPAVAQLCHQLDGIPLALELAAARVKLLTVEQIVARLDDRFRLLTGGSRAALPRQQTLRALIDWSYDLLSEAERALLRRLSVFAGGWSLETAEAICDGDGIEDWEVLDLLTQLVDKSLVVMDEEGGDARYRLLETIRQYSAENLQRSGEAGVVRQRHRDWYLELAERAETALYGPEQPEWLDRLEQEHDNLRVALAGSLTGDAAAAGLRLGGAMWEFWSVRGYLTEGRERLAALLALPEASEHAAARAKALKGAAALAQDQGDYEVARQLYEESLAIRRELGDTLEIANLLNNLGYVVQQQGCYAAAGSLLQQSLAIYRDLGDEAGVAMALQNLGIVAQQQGDCEEARRFYQDSLAIQRARHDSWNIATLLNNVGNVAIDQGDYEAAQAHLSESLKLYQELRCKSNVARSLGNLAIVAQRQGNWEQAISLHVESLQLFRELGSKGEIATCLEVLGEMAVAQERFERAARLFGTAEALREAIGAPRPPADCPSYDAAVGAATKALGTEAFEAARALGRASSLEEAITYALAHGDGSSGQGE
jgi:predicted ATPase/class 3 adenylate cyclase